jgi:hypothetical protein
MQEPAPKAPDRDAHGDLYEEEPVEEYREHTPEEAAEYARVMAKARRLMFSFTVAKIGIIALMFAVVWRFWGPGAD